MSTPPRRLKDDPDFLWETGCDLADEAFAVGGYGLPGLRANVLAATQPPSAGAPLRSTRSWSVAAKIGGVLALLGLGGLAGVGMIPVATDATPVDTTVAPVAAPIEVDVTPVSGAVGVDEALDAKDDLSPGHDAPVVGPSEDAVAPTAVPARPVPVARPASGQGDAPMEDLGGDAAVPSGGAPDVVAAHIPHGSGVDEPTTHPVSTLAAEVAMYDRATDRLAGGDADGAILEYQSYLERYPDGRLVMESELGLLRAQVAVGPSEAVETLAVRLLADGDLVAKHIELRRMRADNLVLLGRCDDALAVARDLSSRDAAPIRRACRWKP